MSACNLGLGLLFYSFHAARAALDATVIEWEERINPPPTEKS